MFSTFSLKCGPSKGNGTPHLFLNFLFGTHWKIVQKEYNSKKEHPMHFNVVVLNRKIGFHLNSHFSQFFWEQVRKLRGIRKIFIFVQASKCGENIIKWQKSWLFSSQKVVLSSHSFFWPFFMIWSFVCIIVHDFVMRTNKWQVHCYYEFLRFLSIFWWNICIQVTEILWHVAVHFLILIKWL